MPMPLLLLLGLTGNDSCDINCLVCVQGCDRGGQRSSQAKAQEISLLAAKSVVCGRACWHAGHHAPFVFQNDTASPVMTDAECQ